LLIIQTLGLYINPTNARLSGEEFTLERKDPNLPNDQFEPQLSSFSGANYWDRDTNLLYVIVRGSQPIDIRTTPVIQVGLTKLSLYSSITFKLFSTESGKPVITKILPLYSLHSVTSIKHFLARLH
jgi:hypothetical protein